MNRSGANARGSRVLAVLVVASVLALAQLPAQQPAVPPDNFFGSNGVRIRYVDQGQGAPVVLIHGGERGVLRHPEFLTALREFLRQAAGTLSTLSTQGTQTT
jgi:hypothetical protein